MSKLRVALLALAAVGPPGAVAGYGIWLPRALTVAYVTGVACGVGWLTLGHLGVAWLGRGSTPPS